MPLDPMTIVMFALIALLIFFMFRNGRKRQAQMQELQSKMVPGAEVMLQSGIYATIDSIDEEENRATVTSGNSTFVVHRNAIGQVVTPVNAPEAEDSEPTLAPDDDPAFGERLNAPEAPSESAAPSDDAAADVEAASEDTEKPSDKE